MVTKKSYPPVRLSLSARLISRETMFFSHSKSATAGYKLKKQPAEQACIYGHSMVLH
jgi:hypothetical protein